MTRAALDEIRRAAMWFEPTPDGLDPLLQSIGDARLVLIGEASHGTHEFYQIRADLTKALIARHGFNVVAVEADWPDSFGASTRAPTLLIVGGDDQPVIEMIATRCGGCRLLSNSRSFPAPHICSKSPERSNR